MPLNTGHAAGGSRLRRRRTPRRLAHLFLLSSLCILPTLARNAPQSKESGPPSSELTPGASATRELAAGETLAFEFSPGARRVLQLSIDKGDMRVAVALYEPGGRKVFEQLSQWYESLEMSVIAESAGVYRLEVRSLEKDGAGRRFELKVHEARAAAGDVQSGAARAAFAEASRLRAEWAEASLRGAVEKYAEAARWWRSAGDARSAADAAMAEAEVRFVLGEYRPALILYRQAVADSRRAADRLREAEALCHAGRLLSHLGDNDQALKHLKQGLDYYSRDGVEQTPRLKHSHAEALSHVSEIYYSKGDLFKSSEQLARALGIFAEVGDRRGEARARLFVGYVSGAIGEREKTLAQFSRALELYRATEDRAGEALSLTALGIAHSQKGQEGTALRLHREALSIFRVIGDRQSEAIALNGVGQAYQNLHEIDLALENYKEALRLFQANGSLDFAAATVYQIAATHGSKKEYERALAYLDRCVKLSRAARKRRIEAYALNEVAAIYAAQGSGRQTVGQYRKILKFYAEVGDPRGRPSRSTTWATSTSRGTTRATRWPLTGVRSPSASAPTKRALKSPPCTMSRARPAQWATSKARWPASSSRSTSSNSSAPTSAAPTSARLTSRASTSTTSFTSSC